MFDFFVNFLFIVHGVLLATGMIGGCTFMIALFLGWIQLDVLRKDDPEPICWECDRKFYCDGASTTCCSCPDFEVKK